MGFFDFLSSATKSIGQSVQNAHANMVIDSWKQLSSFSKDRTKSMISMKLKEKPLSALGALAILHLLTLDAYERDFVEEELRKNGISFNEVVNRIKRLILNDSIQLGKTGVHLSLREKGKIFLDKFDVR